MSTKAEPRVVKKLFGEVQSMIDALQANLSTTSALPMEGQNAPTSEVIGALSSKGGLQGRVTAARVALTKAVADRDAGLEEVRIYLNTVRAAIVALKGAGSSELAAFGIVPPRARTPLTPAELVMAAAKASATRKLRRTLGKRQREQLTTAGHAGVSVVTPDGSSIPVVPHVAPVGIGAQADQPPNGSSGSANGRSSANVTASSNAGTSNGSSGGPGNGSH